MEWVLRTSRSSQKIRCYRILIIRREQRTAIYLFYEITNIVKHFQLYIQRTFSSSAWTAIVLCVHNTIAAHTEELKVGQNRNNWRLGFKKIWTILKATNLMLRSVLAINMIVTLKSTISIAIASAIQTVKKPYICRRKGTLQKIKPAWFQLAWFFNKTRLKVTHNLIQVPQRNKH